MRKFVTLLIIAAAWYFAGMNRQPYLMAAAICAVIFVVFSFVLARVLRHKLSADIPEQSSVIYKDHETPLIIRTENRSRFPITKYCVTVLMRYKGNKSSVLRRLNGSAGRNSDNKNNTASLFYTAPYSGVVRIYLLRLRVYDYFMIFSSSKKLHDVIHEVIVLPSPKKMNITMPPFGTYTNEPVAQSNSDKKGEDHSEIRLVREYRQGDLIRHMHRNYSARTETIWIKEYQKENDFIFDLYLDTSSAEKLSVTDIDAYSELLCSLLNNLMEYDIIIKIHYYDRASNDMKLYELDKKSKIDDFMTEFFKAESFCTEDEYCAVCKVSPEDNVMLINTSLNWYFGGKHIYTFNKDNIIDEITKQYFELN